MRKKILIIAPWHRGVGGAESYVISLMDEAVKRHNVFLATLSKPPENWQGTPIHKVLGICRQLYSDAWYYMRHDIDTVDCHGLQAALVGCALRLKWKFKMCVTILALYDFDKRPWWFRLACRTILNRADVIFVEGQTGRRDLLDCGVRPEKIKPFMHWVDTNVYKPVPRKHDGLHVLYVGRPLPIKGKHIIEEAERRLFYIKDLEFRYIENCPHKDLIKHYQWADILVVPSQYSEGFPRVVFEGAACGCAIIATHNGALGELTCYFGLNVYGDKTFDGRILQFYNDRKRLALYHWFARYYAEKYFTPKNGEVILNEY